MHKIWNNKIMEDNFTKNGYPILEVDESENIGNNEVIYWIFGIIDRITKESRVFCIFNDRTSNKLKKNIIVSNEN